MNPIPAAKAHTTPARRASSRSGRRNGLKNRRWAELPLSSLETVGPVSSGTHDDAQLRAGRTERCGTPCQLRVFERMTRTVSEQGGSLLLIYCQQIGELNQYHRLRFFYISQRE